MSTCIRILCTTIGSFGVVNACADRDVGTSASALTSISPPVLVSTPAANDGRIPNGGGETVATYFGINQGEANGIAVAYNSDSCANNTCLGYMVSTNGTTWSGHNASEYPYFSNTALAGGQGVQVCPTSNPPDQRGYCGYEGDPAITSTGFSNQLLLGSLVEGDDPNLPTHDVALLLSTNAGNTFNGTPGLALGDASGSPCDGPSMASNQHGTVYVWFTQHVSEPPSNWKEYIRKVTVTSGGTMSLGPLIDMTSKLPVPIVNHAVIAVKPNTGSGLDTIYLAYADNYEAIVSDCSAPGNWAPITMTWHLAVSVDSGTTWVDRVALTDPQWHRCITNQGPLPNGSGASRPQPTVSYEPASGRVIMGIAPFTVFDTANNCVGTRAVILEWPDWNNNDAFSGYYNICNPALCPPGVPGPCAFPVGPAPVGETYCDAFGVESSAMYQTFPKAAWAWHSTADSTGLPPVGGSACANPRDYQIDIWGGSFQPGAPRSPYLGTISRITPLGGGVPWLQRLDVQFLNTPWGDYEGMTVFHNSFFSFWGDNRVPNATSVYSAHFSP